MEKHFSYQAEKEKKLLEVSNFFQELRFSSLKEGSLERMKRRLLSFNTLRE